jgi:hypothetical protein
MELEQVYAEYIAFTDQMITKHKPMGVAGVMMAISLSMYKTSMSEEEYNSIVDVISSSRNNVKKFMKPVIQ